MAASGTWQARLQVLERNVGHGDLVGTYNVNQRYAAYQHVHRDLRHPRGGGPDYVSAPLAARHRVWIADIARKLLSGRAGDAMADAMDDLDQQVRVLAPVDLNNLRRSGSVEVTSGGATIYSRAAQVRRLPEGRRR